MGNLEIVEFPAHVRPTRGLTNAPARIDLVESRVPVGLQRAREVAQVTLVNDSQMATSMEQMQQGERFMIIDPPSLPLRPDFPNRLKMCEAGLGAGFALGLLVVVLLEFRDDRLFSDREIGKLISAPVICEIPEILDPSDARRQKLRMALGWAMATLVACAILSGSAFSYLHS